MSACAQCGTVAKPTDKFCNVCGTPIPAGPPGAMPGAPPPGFGAPPQQGYQPPPQGYGAPQGGFAPPQPGFPPPQPGPPGGFGAPAYSPPPGPADATAPAKILRGFLVAYGANPSGDFWPLTG